MGFLKSYAHYLQAKNFKRNVILGFLSASLLFWCGLWVYGKFYVSTDDAYVNANIVQIAPRVTGQVSQLLVNNNQAIVAGQPLFEIDPQPFEVALEKAQAQLTINQAQFINAKATADRKNTLVTRKFISAQESDNANTALQTAVAGFQLANATLKQAKLDLSWTKVIAPASGWVTNLSLRAGDNVAANQPLFALISNDEFWLDANFKETEVANIKPGQLATIHLDSYPDHTFQGVVQSISGGTGSAFSLLPPQNATGNWVKITQRIPVRIKIINPDLTHPLRIGSSASVTVHLHQFQK